MIWCVSGMIDDNIYIHMISNTMIIVASSNINDIDNMY